MATRPPNVPLRLSVVLSLACIIPAISVTLVIALDDTGVKSPIHDLIFVLMLVGTGQLVGVTFLLWRRFVTWTFRRVAGTGAATIVLLTHLLLWQPLWAAGCGREDMLRFGQSCGMAGLWIVVTAYLWWGIAEGLVAWRRHRMPPYAVRVIYGMALIPFIPGLWFVVALVFGDLIMGNAPSLGNAGERLVPACAHFVCGLVIVIWWWLVWRRAVRWTPSLTRRYVWLGFAFLLLVTLAPLPEYGPGVLGTTGFTGPLILTGLWFVITTWMWQPHTADLMGQVANVKERLTCVSCGYSLVGLHEARCPECGEGATLDELFERVLVAQGFE